jgi:hypothetical protein
MSSWGPGFVQKKGHLNLSHYHHVGFESFAAEYFKLIRSVMYTQDLNEFLFVFDKVNSVSPSLGLFENTLKKNNYIRFLPYYPSSGFNVADRKDLVEPSIHKVVHDRPSFFVLFKSIFQLQDKIKEAINKLYTKKEISILENNRIGVCLTPIIEFQRYIDQIQKKTSPPNKPLEIFVSSTKEQYQAFKLICPSYWTLVSMWDVLPETIVTEEQKVDVFTASLGSLIALGQCEYILGSLDDPTFRFLFCQDGKFRDSTQGIVLDGSSFSYF